MICPDYPVEQLELLRLANKVGSRYEYALTLPAIVKQESFVGDYIIKANENDGAHGSYGITHINLETALWLHGVPDTSSEREWLIEALMNSNLFALKTAVMKLDSVNFKSWKQLWAAYNGAGPKAREYATKIASHVREFQVCNIFKN